MAIFVSNKTKSSIDAISIYRCFKCFRWNYVLKRSFAWPNTCYPFRMYSLHQYNVTDLSFLQLSKSIPTPYIVTDLRIHNISECIPYIIILWQTYHFFRFQKVFLTPYIVTDLPFLQFSKSIPYTIYCDRPTISSNFKKYSLHQYSVTDRHQCLVEMLSHLKMFNYHQLALSISLSHDSWPTNLL